jgi:hypothetical protein
MSHNERLHDMNEEMNFTDEVSEKAIQYLAKNYIESSMIFSKNARLIELKENIDYYDKSNHLANAIGAVLFSVLYLESTINEFYINVIDYNDYKSDKRAKNKKIISEFWNSNKFVNFSILEKYQYALILLDCDKFDENKNPFQNIKILISLRNYLVHYRPEWVELKTNPTDKTEIVNLEKKLKGKFEAKKLFQNDNDIFPNRYLVFSCTDWAISNCIQFVNDFYNKLDSEYIFSEIITELRKYYSA